MLTRSPSHCNRRSGSADKATTIYKTLLKGEAAKKLNWINVTHEEVIKEWTVEKNAIPSLQFLRAS